MGLTHSVEYQTDPKLLELVDSLQKRLKALEEQAKKQQDPQLYVKLEKELFKMFMNSLSTLQFQDAIKRSSLGERHIVFIGNISTGKTSLLNSLFGLDLEVGMSHTTTETTAVVKDTDNKLIVWDSPGNNQDFNYLDPHTLHLFHSCDLVFIIFDSSLLTCDKIVQTIAKIKKEKCILLRSKCDTWMPGHKKTIDEEVATDKKILADWGINDVPIYKTSARGGFDNDKVYFVYFCLQYCSQLIGKADNTWKAIVNFFYNCSFFHSKYSE